MKKVFSLLLCSILLFGLCGCDNSKENTLTNSNNEIVVSVFYFDNAISKKLFSLLDDLGNEYNIKLNKYDIYDENSKELMNKVDSAFNEEIDYIPYIIINNKSLGTYKEEKNNELKEVVKQESKNQ